MIEKCNNNALDFFKRYFEDYRITEDPFEHVAIYTDKEVVGAICYSIIYERAEINYIAVAEEYRGHGIASKLLDYALNDMTNNGACSVSLEVESNNVPAINLYLKHGFIKEAIRKNYYGNNDGYLMVRELEVR